MAYPMGMTVSRLDRSLDPYSFFLADQPIFFWLLEQTMDPTYLSKSSSTHCSNHQSRNGQHTLFKSSKHPTKVVSNLFRAPNKRITYYFLLSDSFVRTMYAELMLEFTVYSHNQLIMVAARLMRIWKILALASCANTF